MTRQRALVERPGAMAREATREAVGDDDNGVADGDVLRAVDKAIDALADVVRLPHVLRP